MNIKRTNKKGFTITELVIVIAVIAILVAVLIPTFGNVFEQSRQSAALQTCSNALKDYSAIVAGDGGTPQNGLVFVSNNYVFVYFNSALHLVGELDDLTYVDTDAKYYEGTLEYGDGSNNYVSGTDAIQSIKLTVDDVEKTLTIKTTAPATGDKDTDIAIGAIDNGKNAECIYFYTVVVNETSYEGYFTLETGEDPSYQTQSATYSRVFGYARNSTTDGRAISLKKVETTA